MIYDLSTGTVVSTLDHDAVTVAFSPNCPLLASASSGDDGSICVWDVQTATLAKSEPLLCRDVAAICFSPGGSDIAVECTDRTMTYDTKANVGLQPLRKSHSGPTFCAHLDQTVRIVTGSGDGTIRLWGIKGRELAIVNAGSAARDLSLSPDDAVLSAVLDRGSVLLIDFPSMQIRTKVDLAMTVIHASLSPAGFAIATIVLNSTLQLVAVRNAGISRACDCPKGLQSCF